MKCETSLEDKIVHIRIAEKCKLTGDRYQEKVYYQIATSADFSKDSIICEDSVDRADSEGPKDYSCVGSKRKLIDARTL